MLVLDATAIKKKFFRFLASFMASENMMFHSLPRSGS
jgi:hypothetical protein